MEPPTDPRATPGPRPRGLRPKVPWLPAEVQPGQKTEVCPRCGAHKMIPWTLKRDTARIGLLRTWVCTACQLVEERPEAE